MATRASVLSMARMRSQVPTTLLGDTQAYLLLDEEDRNFWNELSILNPMLLSTSADVTFPANLGSYAVTSPVILRLVMIGKKASTGMRFLFEYPLKWLEFVELEAQNLVNSSPSSIKFHWDGGTIHARPFPSEATVLKLVYVPPITLGTGTGGNVLGGNVYLQQFADLLATRLAVQMCAIQGRDTSYLEKMAKDRLDQVRVQVAKCQDVEGNHVAFTGAYQENIGELGGTTEY